MFTKKVFDNKSGFTLLELLIVISIIIILAGTIMPAINIARTRAFKSKTKAKMASLELALAMYEADNGTFPDQLSAGALPAHWFTGSSEPYMEFKQDELDPTGKYVVDAWGIPFRYQSPGSHRKLSFDLWSFGRNGVDDAGEGDDIINW